MSLPLLFTLRPRGQFSFTWSDERVEYGAPDHARLAERDKARLGAWMAAQATTFYLAHRGVDGRGFDPRDRARAAAVVACLAGAGPWLASVTRLFLTNSGALLVEGTCSSLPEPGGGWGALMLADAEGVVAATYQQGWGDVTTVYGSEPEFRNLRLSCDLTVPSHEWPVRGRELELARYLPGA